VTNKNKLEEIVNDVGGKEKVALISRAQFLLSKKNYSNLRKGKN